jgi:hypothetical protein
MTTATSRVPPAAGGRGKRKMVFRGLPRACWEFFGFLFLDREIISRLSFQCPRPLRKQCCPCWSFCSLSQAPSTRLAPSSPTCSACEFLSSPLCAPSLHALPCIPSCKPCATAQQAAITQARAGHSFSGGDCLIVHTHNHGRVCVCVWVCVCMRACVQQAELQACEAAGVLRDQQQHRSQSWRLRCWL